MPFTLSHAVAVLPAIRTDGTARGPLFASALVLGSFAPDMTHFAASFVPGAMTLGGMTHRPVGVPTVDVAITTVLLAAWLMVRDPLVALLPDSWRARVHTVLRGRAWGDRPPLVAAFWFYTSAVLGATTHVVWDAFTHFNRWGVRQVPVLGEVVAGYPLYTYAQYGSSLLALVALTWFVVSALRHAEPALPPGHGLPRLGGRERRIAGAVLGMCVLAGIVHRCVRWYAHWGRNGTPFDLIPTVCFGAGAGLATGLLIYGLAIRLRTRG